MTAPTPYPPFSFTLDLSTMDTEALLQLLRDLELRRDCARDNIVACQAYVLRLAEVERWIAIHNVRAQRRLDAGEPHDPTRISTAVVVRMIEVLGDIVLEMQRRAVLAAGKVIAGAALTDEQISKVAMQAFLAGGEELRRVARASAPSPPVPQGELALDGDAL